MSNSVAALSAVLLQQQLDIILKPHGHGGGRASTGQKFSELAQAQVGIPFVPHQPARTLPLLKAKQTDRKDRRPRARADDSEDESRTPQRRSQRRATHVDVTV